jgi:hypothetical protein
VAEKPDGIVLAEHRDMRGRTRQIWVRRAILAAILVVPALGLFNVFGQRPHITTADVAAARLEVYAPSRLRGGVFFEGRLHIDAKHEVKDARVVLDPGWAEGMSMNTIEPAPVGEASDNGRLAFDLGHIPAGNKHLLFMQFQVNATNIAWKRRADVRLYDGDVLLARVNHTFTVWP